MEKEKYLEMRNGLYNEAEKLINEVWELFSAPNEKRGILRFCVVSERGRVDTGKKRKMCLSTPNRYFYLHR